ncbi:testis-expressed protein 13A [Eulemur rufifrons]|uniref:testis-expressed protein 13A n=1 Tax=Eulemur rufifrons TaxID=859984 RepID=UPI0037444234
MALKPEDPCGGFQHARVVAFVNEKMAEHVKGPEFYIENMFLSWEEVEDKLKDILEDEEMSSQAKEACAWGCLALGIRFARRREQLQGRRLQWLQDFSKLHRSAAEALASDLKELTAQREMEREDSAFRLRRAQANLAEVQKEQGVLRWKLFQAELKYHEQVKAQWAGTDRAHEEEEAAMAVAAGAAEGGREQRGVEAGATFTEAAQELNGGFLQLLGDTEENYTSGGEREGNLRSVETAMFSSSGIQEPQANTSGDLLPVQLPPSFTYTYSSPLTPFSAEPSLFPPAATVTAPPPPQMPPYWGACDTSLWSGVGYQGIDPQEPQRDRRDSEPHHQRTPVFRRPGDWDCPWCKAMNFSRREICFRCGRGIWLQGPQ